jgi:hypothetical protein
VRCIKCGFILYLNEEKMAGHQLFAIPRPGNIEGRGDQSDLKNNDQGMFAAMKPASFAAQHLSPEMQKYDVMNSDVMNSEDCDGAGPVDSKFEANRKQKEEQQFQQNLLGDLSKQFNTAVKNCGDRQKKIEADFSAAQVKQRNAISMADLTIESQDEKEAQKKAIMSEFQIAQNKYKKATEINLLERKLAVDAINDARELALKQKAIDDQDNTMCKSANGEVRKAIVAIGKGQNPVVDFSNEEKQTPASPRVSGLGLMKQNSQQPGSRDSAASPVPVVAANGMSGPGRSVE